MNNQHPQPKPGYLTTEFWTAVLSAILSFFVAITIITQAQSDQYFALIAPVITAVLPAITYIHSRGKVKSAIAIIEPAPEAK